MKKLLVLTIMTLAVLFLFSAASPAGQIAATAASSASGSIAGNIADASGRPIAGATADAYSCSNGSLAASAVSTKDGNYLIKAPYGRYYLRFSGQGYESSWHGAPPLRETATEITVSGEAVKGIDSKLDEGGASITGTVKTPDGKGLAGAWVSVGSWDAERASASDARTDQNGNFSISVSPGNYAVGFAAKGYVSKILGKSLLEPRMVEAVEGKATGGIDAALAKGGSIIGTVTDQTGRPLKGIFAAAVLDGEVALPVMARTDAAGKYALEGVTSGRYSIHFSDPQRKYLPQRNVGEFPSAVVTATGVTTVPPVTFTNAGGISGRVTDAAGNAIAHVLVSAQAERGYGVGISDETGAYSIWGLAAGKYTLVFKPQQGPYLSRYYRDGASAEAAVPVEVNAAQVISNIDQALPTGQMLAGTVSNSSGEGIEGATVLVYPLEAERKAPFSMAITGRDGAFSVAVADGVYIAAADATGFGYLQQWSGNKPRREDAAHITVSKEGPGNGVDFILVRGGSISGTVRNAAGAAIADARITASDAATGDDGNTTTSDNSGRYTIKPLPSGSYRLSANASGAGYMEAKVPQAVTVTAGAVADNVDIVLAPGGSIAGKVTDGDGNPIVDAVATAYDPATWDDVATAWTDASGHYKIGGLPDNRYRVRFEKGNSKYPIQWYKGKFRREESAAVEVAGTTAVEGIDAVLVPGVPLSGTVTGPNGAPLPDTEVEVYGVSEDESFADVHTDVFGRYSIPSLAPGSYRVRFSHDNYVPRWYGGNDRNTAAAVPVKDIETGAVNATLVKAAGKFSGKLMNPEGQKRGEAWVTALDAATGVAVADEMICECSGEFHTPVPGGLYKLRVERHGQTV